jgi:AbrB family looped-hinge helix DNA binding protein
MRAAIDDAGRVVIPKRLRDELGIVPGPVEVVRDGAGVRIEPLSDPTLERVGARLVIPATGSAVIDDDVVREMRLSEQR